MSVAHLRRERAALTQSNEQLSTTLSVAEASRASAAKTALLNECEVTAAREALVQRLARRRQRLNREDRVVALRAQALAVRRAALETAEHEAAGPL